MADTRTYCNNRIPITLQAVFLASNRGIEVHQPPPKRVVFKSFMDNWLNRNGKKNETQLEENPTMKQYPSSSPSLKPKGDAKKKSKNEDRHEEAENKKARKICTSSRSTKKSKRQNCFTNSDMSPQQYVDELMSSRGYCTRRFNTLRTAYSNKPTPLQQASYDLHLISLIKSNEYEVLDDILQSGISSNPCNFYGESLIHMVSRRGDQRLLQTMIQNGSRIQVSDDHGRTPLHDAFWSSKPAFETVEMLLHQDLTLLRMTDCRGFLPLAYTRKQDWPEWINFFDNRKDIFWPDLNSSQGSLSCTRCSTITEIMELIELNPNSKPIPDPKNALSLKLAQLVASGTIQPKDAIRLNKSASIVSDSEDDFDDDETSSDHDGDNESCLTDDEMDALIATLPIRLGGSHLWKNHIESRIPQSIAITS